MKFFKFSKKKKKKQKCSYLERCIQVLNSEVQIQKKQAMVGGIISDSTI